MKDTYDTQIKKEARQKARSTLSRIYGNSDPKNIKVATLMGHELIEYDQIWQPLGIPPENIVCLENENKAYRSLKDEADKRDLDFQINKEDAIKYFAENDENFDIINLDFPNQFNIKNRNILREIAGRSLLGREDGQRGDKGVLMTWFLGSRENYTVKNWFNGQAHDYNYTEDLKETVDKNKGLDYREEITSRMVASIFMDGNLNLKPHPLVKGGPLKQEFIEAFKEYCDKYNKEIEKNGYELTKLNVNPEDLDELSSILPLLESQKSSSKLPTEVFPNPYQGPRFFYSLYSGSQTTLIRDYLFDKFQEEDSKMILKELKEIFPMASKDKLIEMYTEVPDALFYYNLEPYVIDENNRFHYKSGSKGQSPMNVDVNSLSKVDFKPLKRLVDYKIKDNDIELEISRLKHDFLRDEVKDWIKNWQVYRGCCFGDSLAPQEEIMVNAGSKTSCKVRSKNERECLKKLSQKEKEEIYFWLDESDIKDEEIMKEYDITKMQLAGYKAAKKRKEK